eukprot:TRINITY_DN17918_c0_g1_i1.p1 TRINITY_DN17918_c0_g1~~TRINITY_DN17918_c0_g1_i1.p1  ORF type:complete len:462 (+),score=91.55 TRINITY_DN17918_c0_g1_i1:65-1387(+)
MASLAPSFVVPAAGNQLPLAAATTLRAAALATARVPVGGEAGAVPSHASPWVARTVAVLGISLTVAHRSLQRRMLRAKRRNGALRRRASAGGELGPQWGPVQLVVDDDWDGLSGFRDFLVQKVNRPSLWEIVSKDEAEPNYRVDGSMLTAVLPGSEALLPFCEKDPGPLSRELEYRSMLEPPSTDDAARVDAACCLRAEGSGAEAAGTWWQDDAVASKGRAALEVESFFTLDNFLKVEEAQAVADAVKALRTGKVMKKGETTGGNTRVGLPHRGDTIVWLPFRTSDGDASMEPFRHLSSQIEVLASRIPELAGAGWCSQAMATCYPGRTRARYFRHIDNSSGNGRLFTAILYLNPDWNGQQHGGQLRMFGPGERNFAVKHEIEPLFNRLLIFWSDNRCPHEVLSAAKDRLAVTVWFYDDNIAPAALGVPVTPVELAGAPQ